MAPFLQAQAQQDHDFVKNTKGFMFFSTPHLGTNVARLNSPTKFLFFPSTEVCELEEDSPQLVDLNQNFVELGTIHILRNHFSKNYFASKNGLTYFVRKKRSSDRERLLNFKAEG